MHSISRHKKLFILTGWLLAANFLVLLIRPAYIINLIFVYIPPLALTLFWIKRSRTKLCLFAVISTLLFAVPLELIARMANNWDVATLFSRLFGIAPVENLVYAFINFLFPLAFYELFSDNDRSSKISGKWKYLVVLYFILSLVTYTLFYSGYLIGLPYWLIGAVVVCIPMAFIFYRKPHLLAKTIVTTIFFAGTFFLNEMVSMSIGNWWWPGEYLMPVSLAGQRFPLDDVIIWYFLSTPALIGGYEYFMDDFR